MIKDSFNNLLDELRNCDICKEKFEFQPHPIILGNINSKIVQISQAPSATVHETLKHANIDKLIGADHICNHITSAVVMANNIVSRINANSINA